MLSLLIKARSETKPRPTVIGLPPSVAIMTCQSPRTSRILRSSHFLVFFSTSVYLSREAELLADLGVAGSVPLLPRYELPPPC